MKRREFLIATISAGVGATGDHQHVGIATLADRSAQVEAIAVGQGEVEHHQVGAHLTGERLDAIRDETVGSNPGFGAMDVLQGDRATLEDLATAIGTMTERDIGRD